MKSEIYIILDNIRSVHNVGSVFRTSDAFDVTKIFLVGTTPTPLDRFGQKRSDVAKVALGAEESVGWEHVEDVKEAISQLKSKGVRIVGVEQHKDSQPLTVFKNDMPTAYILGNEVHGISEEVLGECDAIAEIPMQGTKESLNVSVTAGIVLFAVTQT